jgi:tRNA 5-methylaminomethyl-2-thiouridine biosynthesis bifunctional protein
MLPKVMSHPPIPNFHASHWKNRAACQTSWHALETSFGRGESFLETVKAWQSEPASKPKLFFTAFTSVAPTDLSTELAQVCYGLLPGVHRISFEGGCVQLTLCIGEAPHIAKEIDIAADSICVDHLATWNAKTLARLCQVGSQIKWLYPQDSLFNELQSVGFILDESTSSACYRPTWEVKTSLRQRTKAEIFTYSKPQVDAIVIGAGLAGAAVAHSLALRGWQVEVLDKADALGAGASGLPAGIFATHVSPDNNVLSRITRDGVRATVQRAQELLKQGLEWQASHLLEHRYAGKRQLPEGPLWPAAGHEWSTQASEFQKQASGLNENTPALWHGIAGWIQTQALVKAQLRHCKIRLSTQSEVAKLIYKNNQWQCIDASGLVIAQAPQVIIASAYDGQSLIDSVELQTQQYPRPHLPATALRGQVSLGPMSILPAQLRNKLPNFPVNGHGSYIGHLQAISADKNEPYWIVGSSFQRNDFDLQTRDADQLTNRQLWAELMPEFQDDILHIDLEKTSSWAAIRMALPDRLPAVGEFAHPEFKGLNVCTGMGARGISWSVLCGELLAANLNHEPLPIAASLAKLMAAARFG